MNETSVLPADGIKHVESHEGPKNVHSCPSDIVDVLKLFARTSHCFVLAILGVNNLTYVNLLSLN